MDLSRRLSICLLLSVAAVTSQDAAEPTETPPQPCNLDDPADLSPCPPVPTGTQCSLPERSCTFMKKGLAGGGTHHHCENTIASAELGLKNGADILEVDVCISKDNVPFLWYDCEFYSPLAIARRLGQFLNGKCAPHIHRSAHSAEIQSTRDLTWAEIQEKLSYVHKSDWCVSDPSEKTSIISLEEFLRHFANNQRVRHFQLDIKVALADIALTTRRAFRLTECLRVSSKTIFGYNNEEKAEAGQCGLRQVGGNPKAVTIDFDLNLDDFGTSGLVLEGLKGAENTMRDELQTANVCSETVRKTVLGQYAMVVEQGLNAILPVINSSSPANPLLRLLSAVRIARELCVQYVNIGVPQVDGGFQMLGKILDGILASRDASDKNLYITAFGFQKDTHAAAMISKGVDGLSHGDIRRVVHTLKILKAGGCGWKCHTPVTVPEE